MNYQFTLDFAPRWDKVLPALAQYLAGFGLEATPNELQPAYRIARVAGLRLGPILRLDTVMETFRQHPPTSRVGFSDSWDCVSFSFKHLESLKLTERGIYPEVHSVMLNPAFGFSVPGGEGDDGKHFPPLHLLTVDQPLNLVQAVEALAGGRRLNPDTWRVSGAKVDTSWGPLRVSSEFGEVELRVSLAS